MPKWQKLQKGNPCKMRYHNITKDDMLNGDGLRAVLWVAGCTHKCKGCHNPVTWDIEGGIPFDEAAKEELFEALKPDYITGVTFSGGDPLPGKSCRSCGISKRDQRNISRENHLVIYRILLG